eukprot:2492764-Rhodomonas_salina.2
MGKVPPCDESPEHLLQSPAQHAVRSQRRTFFHNNHVADLAEVFRGEPRNRPSTIILRVNTCTRMRTRTGTASTDRVRMLFSTHKACHCA